MNEEGELEEVNLVRTREDAVNWLVEMTGCTVQHAGIALSRSGGDISDAIDILPEVQKVPCSTEQEIRRLIDTADANTSTSIPANSNKDIIEISDGESDTEMSNDVTNSNDDVTNSNDDVTNSNDDVSMAGGGTESAVDRICKKLGVSAARAQAALTLTNNDEDSAVDVISRQLRKRKKPGDSAVSSSEHTPSATVPFGPWELVVLSWNIDGLCERGITERFSSVISEIKTINPHVVMLQEVVDEHVSRIRESLGRSYDITLGDRSSPYFNVILITKSVGGLKVLEKNVKKFPNSSMGRHFVQVVCELQNKEFRFYTSHLESMKDYSAERTKQLEKTLDFIFKQDYKSPGISIFGGDMNIRDHELNRVRNLAYFQDVWEKTGREQTTRYTWDTTTNTNTGAPYKCKLRFDRVYLRKSALCTPKSLSLVGQTKLQSCDMFPSDHWGLLARFNIK